MDFMSIGSINSYVKTMNMENKWQAKKNSGNFAADGAKTIGEWMENQKKKTEEKTSALKNMGNKSDSTLNNIRNKLTKGSKLTPTEKEYLRKKDPTMYQKVQNIEAEQKDFENKLRQCKTKDEVRRLKLTYAASALSAVNSIKNSPYISDADKMALISEQQMRMAAIDKSHSDFVRSGEFSDLPTDAERAEAAKKLAEAENGNEESNTDNIEDKNNAEKADSNSSKEVTAEREPKKVKVVNHDKEGKAKVEEKEAPKARRSEGARKMAAKAKAEQSYEVRKTRRSRKAFRTAAAGGNIAAVGGNAKSAASVKQAVSVTPRAIGSSLDVKA
ncbi:MAG: hypothetical protein K2N72_13040 [Oscillospiraceae bacterium]|nr:hypothetical protein [Oscillospiraceae bacterium]